jgi:hypothetical protein
VDDQAWSLLPRDEVTRVLLVTPGNLFLEAPLLLNESIEVTRVTPENYGLNPDGTDTSAGHDITMQEGSAVVRFVGAPRVIPGARAAERTLNLYTLRLRHTTAAAIAPLLMNVLTGSGSTGAPWTTNFMPRI